MKKKLIYGLVVIMSVATLGGCGSKKGEKVDLTLTEVLSNAADKVISVESIEFDISGNLDGKIEQDEKNIEAKGSASLKGSITTEDPSAYMSGKLDYNCSYNKTNLSGEHSLELYGEDSEEEGLFYTYVKLDDGEWEGSTEDIAEFTDVLGELNIDELKEEFDDVKDDEQFNKIFKLNDRVQKANGTDCYLVYANIDRDDLIELVKAESEQDAKDLEAIDKFNLKFEIYFDKETYYPVKLTLKGELKGEDESSNMKIDVKELNLEFNSKVNKAKPVAVPDKVKEEAVIDKEMNDTTINISDMLP